MSVPPPLNNPKVFSPLLWWGLIAVYTFLLPDAIILYTFIREKFGIAFAGKIPAFLVVFFGLAYILYLRYKKIPMKNLGYLIPCALIVLIIFNSVSNPNKHIHIPEYVILSWLVYAALSRNYAGKGIFILVFLCTSLLGVVDELEQGIRPGRFYGWSDMLVNSASALIGVFLLLGIKKIKAHHWAWMLEWKKYKVFLGLIIFGITGGFLMCTNLFSVQAQEGIFWGVYPEWLLAWNILYLIITPIIVFFSRDTLRKNHQNTENQNNSGELPKLATIQLWIFPIVAILFYANVLIAYISITGANFQ
jgi:hypothetical protein